DAYLTAPVCERCVLASLSAFIFTYSRTLHDDSIFSSASEGEQSTSCGQPFTKDSRLIFPIPLHRCFCTNI
ncbi:hypothetical protein BD626DRAFT_554519, partial [Schizophyllum amplum]